MARKNQTPAVKTDSPTTAERVHNIPESVLINPVLLAQYAISAGIISQMAWLTWRIKWLHGLVAHVCEGLSFDFIGNAKLFTAYMADSYANPFVAGAYEPKGSKARSSDNRPQPMPESPVQSSDVLKAWLSEQFSLSEHAVMAVYTALSDVKNESHSMVLADSLAQFSKLSPLGESSRAAKTQRANIRKAVIAEYARRKVYVEDSKTPVVVSPAPIAQQLPNMTDMQALINQMVINALKEAQKTQ